MNIDDLDKGREGFLVAPILDDVGIYVDTDTGGECKRCGKSCNPNKKICKQCEMETGRKAYKPNIRQKRRNR